MISKDTSCASCSHKIGDSVGTMVSIITLTFIGRSHSNHSAFYLYRATSAGLSSTPLLCTCISIKGVWLMYGIVRTLQ